MSELVKIGDLASKYKISSRSLRYYEEIGILSSIRKNSSQYRYYDEDAINRLEQIIILRKLQLPIKDISNIFYSQDLKVAVEAFTRKLKLLEKEIEELDILKEVVQSFLRFLNEKGYSHVDGLYLIQERSEILSLQIKEKKGKHINKEALLMETQSKKLSDHDVRIIELKPMKVAWCQIESTSPEKDAWDIMLKWVEEKGLCDISTTRYFGFNNPSPTKENQLYGYEVWVTVPDGTEGSDKIKVKDFAGGLYAVTNTFLYDIGERWGKLNNWVSESDFEGGKHQWLEESIAPSRMWHHKNTQLDLYFPIQEKSI